MPVLDSDVLSINMTECLQTAKEGSDDGGPIILRIEQDADVSNTRALLGAHVQRQRRRSSHDPDKFSSVQCLSSQENDLTALTVPTEGRPEKRRLDGRTPNKAMRDGIATKRGDHWRWSRHLASCVLAGRLRHRLERIDARYVTRRTRAWLKRKNPAAAYFASDTIRRGLEF
jgi:hypothetical protein